MGVQYLENPPCRIPNIYPPNREVRSLFPRLQLYSLFLFYDFLNMLIYEFLCSVSAGFVRYVQEPSPLAACVVSAWFLVAVGS